MKRGILPGRGLFMAARVLGIAGLVVFGIVVAREGFPTTSDVESWEKRYQALALLLAATGYLVALRWPGPGGAILGSSALALAILGTRTVDPGEAWLGAIAFASPALLFLCAWAPSASRNSRLGVASATLALFAIGSYGVVELYSYSFGPTHPQSPLRAEPVDIVEWAWAGAVTSSSFTVNARVNGDSDAVRLVVATEPGFEQVLAVSAFAQASERENHRIVSLPVSGLLPDTRYHYAVESDGRRDLVRAGTLRTFPAGPTSFTFAVGADARTGSNGLVFDIIREHSPLLFLHLGDFHYANVDSYDIERFQRAYDASLSAPAQAALYRSTATVYVWDDHDFGPPDSNRTSPSRRAAGEVYRRYAPHYELPGGTGGAIYQAFSVGRVRFIVMDTRSARDPVGEASDPSRTMLGEQQLNWVKTELSAANGRYPLIVLASPGPWIGEPADGADEWPGYDAERRDIANFIADNGIRGIMMVSADAHMLAIDDGTNSDYSASGGASFPVLVAAALDRRGSTRGGPYSEGMFPGSGQFGLVKVRDSGGDALTVELLGMNYREEVVVSHTFTVPVQPAASSGP